MATIEELQNKLQKLENQRSLWEWYNGKFLGMILALESQGILTESMANKLRDGMADSRAFANSLYYDFKQAIEENIEARTPKDRQCKK